MTAWHRAYLALGSNLGDRAGYLREAVARIARLPRTRVVAQSTLHETAPWGHVEQPDFLNMVVAIDTALSPEAVLRATQRIEELLGRHRAERWGPRTLDIDLLVYDDLHCATPALTLPHPYLTQRRFVLKPLAEIAPDLSIAGRTVRALLDALDAAGA